MMSKEDDDIDLKRFYDVITTALQEKLKIDKMPFNQFKKTNAFKNLKKSHNTLLKYLKNVVCKDSKNKVFAYNKFYLLSVTLIINWLELCNIPVSISTIINNIDKFPSLLDQSYPEYIENNLIHLIV
jgi:hypothetical protein